MKNLSLKFLRKKYPVFSYNKYSFKTSKNDLEIFFDFSVNSIKFSPKLVIENIDKKRLGNIDNLVFHLGLIELLSYWKAFCSPEISIKCGSLDKQQIEWWKDLILNGMGEFFYQNRIDFRGSNFLKITSGLKKNNLFTGKLKSDILVPISGGKDSIVTLELLKPVKCFGLNPTSATKKIMKIAGCKKPIIVKRKIDKKLLELNRKGFLNGHTPFSAYLAFLTVFCGIIFNYKYIALSNERSSNEGNLKYLGKIINHQYSKTFDFEKKFRQYSKKYLGKDIEYFSFLRPFYEIQIIKIFSSFPKYFSSFISCNEAFKTYSGTKKTSKKWCGSCAKCLFIWTILYPFLNKEKLIKIFGENLFEKKELIPLMKELIKAKPFECVGTEKESLIAFYLSFKKEKDLPILLKHFKEKILPKYTGLEKQSLVILKSWNKNHFIPKKLLKRLNTLDKS